MLNLEISAPCHQERPAEFLSRHLEELPGVSTCSSTLPGSSDDFLASIGHLFVREGITAVQNQVLGMIDSESVSVSPADAVKALQHEARRRQAHIAYDAEEGGVAAHAPTWTVRCSSKPTPPPSHSRWS